MSAPAGFVSVQSPHGAEETVRRFREAVQAAGMTIFAEVDHDIGAGAVGLLLRPTRLVIFGNARGGTPLMQIAQTAGIDLPLKALVWEDVRGQTFIGYNDPQWIAERHGLAAGAAPAVQAMTKGLEMLVAKTTG
ncbi:MAG TPA: DUF302 domain-containing protein [Caulobacteraceae bacterium]|jgi:uncharacterized protein (DUF302 family)|nr:DUF302 domain-containing protein [Caulobacteraceae bacterium]